jgi:F-type H+-transporting ATPase subunit b
MEQIFVQLKAIVIRALPTFFLFVALYFFLKKVLFEPMERVLEERRKRTEGTVEDSQAILAQIEEKLRGYDRSVNEARAAIFQEQEENRKRLAAEQSSLLEGARAKASERVSAAKAELAAEVAASKQTLGAEADRIASEIANFVLTGRA